MNELERRIKAKIPGEDTGITLHRSLCDICAPGTHCGLNAYVKDGKIIKVEGVDGYPNNDGHLCVRGASTRQYVYRKGRIKYPMRRVGERGSGQFERITWEEAFTEITAKLKEIREKDGADSVIWYTGYSKWLRPWLRRMSYSFGSPHYGTESSACAKATMIAWKDICGKVCRGDNKNAGVYMGWGCNAAFNKFTQNKMLRAFKERGGKILIVDTRITPTTERFADLSLQIHPGTDGALALCIGNLLIQKDYINRDYIAKYVHGFEAYKAMVESYTTKRVSAITGITPAEIEAAADLIGQNLPAVSYTPSASIPHHINGYNAMRAIMSLLVITGCIDVKGGSLLGDSDGIVNEAIGFVSHEQEFCYGTRPENLPIRIGAKKFPLWAAKTNEMQAMDMFRAILEEDPRPFKALMALGMNQRMFLESDKSPEAYKKLDLIVAMDIVKTDVCEWADYVLPACTSLERANLKGYGNLLTATKPAIAPLYESMNDVDFLAELARRLDLDDDILKAGYEENLRYFISDLPVTLEELQEADLPMQFDLNTAKPVGYYLEHGFPTPTGKLELYSETIAATGRADLDPLPSYYDAFDPADEKEYPLTLIAGARIANGLHSRMHEVPWARSLRQDPTVDLHPQDAAAKGIREGDDVEIYTGVGSIRVKAHLTEAGLPGDVYMYHGYKEANVNNLLKRDHTDPYSGFAGYRQTRCNIRKAGE